MRSPLTPTDADFDDMHHALGRPDGPHVTPYRNYYCVDIDSDTARRFEVLGSYWLRGGLINGGRDAIYRVTPHGQDQLMAWLVERQQARGLRHWVVTTRLGGPTTVLAKSASAARYAHFLSVGDCWPDGFKSFLSNVTSVRAA